MRQDPNADGNLVTSNKHKKHKNSLFINITSSCRNKWRPILISESKFTLFKFSSKLFCLTNMQWRIQGVKGWGGGGASGFKHILIVERSEVFDRRKTKFNHSQRHMLRHAYIPILSILVQRPYALCTPPALLHIQHTMSTHCRDHVLSIIICSCTFTYTPIYPSTCLHVHCMHNA